MRQIAVLLCTLFFLSFTAAPENGPVAASFRESTAATSGRGEEPDLAWFREQLHIASQYQEQQEGILGMSWLHFLTMAFLFLFFIAAIIIYVLHTRRKQEIIETLLHEEEEKEEEGKSGP